MGKTGTRYILISEYIIQQSPGYYWKFNFLCFFSRGSRDSQDSQELELKKKLSEIFLPATVALTMKKKKGLLTIQDVNKWTGHTNVDQISRKDVITLETSHWSKSIRVADFG
jgi:hypothetical protein